MYEVQDFAPILYDGATAQWCRGGCGKFRYPYCFVGDSPYCLDCTKLNRLNPVKRLERLDRLDKLDIFESKEVKENRPRQLKIVCDFPKPKKPTIKERIVALLQDGPQSSVGLAKTLGNHPISVSNAARLLIVEGTILSVREQSKTPMLWYSLPVYKDELVEKTGMRLKDAINLLINSEPHTAIELHQKLPGYKLHSITCALHQMVVISAIVAKGNNHQRVYGLPAQAELVEQKAIWGRPVRKKILELLQTTHTPLHQREIARTLKIAHRSVSLYLNELEGEGVISSYFCKNRKYYVHQHRQAQ